MLLITPRPTAGSHHSGEGTPFWTFSATDSLASTVTITWKRGLFFLCLSYVPYKAWSTDKVLVYLRGIILTPSNSMQHMRGCLQGKTEEEMCFTSTILHMLLVENENPI